MDLARRPPPTQVGQRFPLLVHKEVPVSRRQLIPRRSHRVRGYAHVLAIFTLTLVIAALGPSKALGQRGGGAGTPEPPPTIEEKTDSMDRLDGFMPIYWEETTG